MVGMVVDVAKWWRALGVEPFLFAMRHSRPDDLRIVLDTAGTCDLKLSFSSIQTPRPLIGSFRAIWELYSVTPLLSWILGLFPMAVCRCISSALDGANLIFKGIACLIRASSLYCSTLLAAFWDSAS